MFTSLVLTKGFPPLSSTRFWGMSISGVLAHSKQIQFFLLLLFRTATLAVTLDAVLPVQVFGVLSKAFLSYEKLEKQEQICHKQEVTTTPNYLPSMTNISRWSGFGNMPCPSWSRQIRRAHAANLRLQAHAALLRKTRLSFIFCSCYHGPQLQRAQLLRLVCGQHSMIQCFKTP